MWKVWNLETKAQESTDFLPKTKSNSSKTTGQERMTKIALGSTEEKHRLQRAFKIINKRD